MSSIHQTKPSLGWIASLLLCLAASSVSAADDKATDKAQDDDAKTEVKATADTTDSAKTRTKAKTETKTKARTETNAKAAEQAHEPATGRKVWTNADLLQFRHRRKVQVISGVRAPRNMPKVPPVQSVRRSNVASRYAEIVGKADAALKRLEREALAGRNPYARGLIAGGPRTADEIKADVELWKKRREAANAALGAAK